MFPYNDSVLANVQQVFVRQFLADIMFEIGAIFRRDNKFEIDWLSISDDDLAMLQDLALECRAKCKEEYGSVYFSTQEYCQAGRLFAYYILGKENKRSDEYINIKDLKVLYYLFLAFSPLNISYKVFGGVTID